MGQRRKLREGDPWPGYSFGLIPDHKYHIKRDPGCGEWNVAIRSPVVGEYWREDWVWSDLIWGDLIAAVNRVACRFHGRPGGSFYYNEYKQVLKPIGSEWSVELHYVGEFDECEFRFAIDDRVWSTNPPDGVPPNGLSAGDSWWGPKCGVPHIIQGNGRIYRSLKKWFENQMVQLEEREYLDLYCSDYRSLSEAIRTVKRGKGGKFYVTEAGMIWAPYKKRGGWGYAYAGHVWNLTTCWYPECE